jgi:hypothetical protein
MIQRPLEVMMSPTSIISDTILAVIRGDLPLSALEEVGIHIIFENDSCEVRSESQVTVKPSASDIARGLLVLRANRDELRRWAFFLLADLQIVDFEFLESHPQGDLLIGALWDASFEGKINKDAISVAESLA